MSSDSDDDVPLIQQVKLVNASKLQSIEKVKNKPKASSNHAVFNVPKPVLPGNVPSKVKSNKKRAASSDDDDDDDDDDKPISTLIKSPIKKEKSESKLKSPSKTRLSSGSISKTSVSVSSTLKENPYENFYHNCSKGRLVQSLLVRWWYAIDWQMTPEEIMRLCPPGFEPLNGFAGVFVSTSTDSLGTICDLRDKDRIPSLRNLSRKSSSELKALCIQALEEQLRQLIAAEGNNTELAKELKEELHQIKKIDPVKADRESKKYEENF